ncbi:MAG TPA: hypothetical protein PLA94_10650 [Myxococcota bacterium]|nr:hypothetical protein [Myxococcota bacterium]
MSSPTRRNLLIGLATGFLAVVATKVRDVFPGDPAEGHQMLDAESIAIVRLLAECFIGPDHALVDIPLEVDHTLAALPEVGELWRRLPKLIEAAPLLEGYFSGFTALSPEDREKFLMGWAASERLEKRQIFNGLRALILSHFYFQPASWTAIGYAGPWVGRMDLPILAPRFPLEVQ